MRFLLNRILVVGLLTFGLASIEGAAWTAKHPFYVSVCQIDFNRETGTFQVSIKIFTDDLERALEDFSGKRIHLGTGKEHEDLDEIIRQYFRKFFHLSINGSPIELQYLGQEVSIDATWCYMESEIIHQPAEVSVESSLNTLPSGNVRVENRLLLDSFEDQTNIVHIKIGDRTRSLLLSKARTSDSADF
jgi:hypothetical protein